MTNDLTIKQAVGELKAMKKHIEPYMSVVGVTAYDMAIKALEQQPCEDCISREDILDYIAKLLSGYLYEEERERLENFTAYIAELPSVTPSIPDVENDFNLGYNCGYADAMCDIGGED